MNKEIFRNIRLGIFMIVGVVLIIVALYFIGNNRNMFGKTFKLYAVFPNVKGLQTGNNVRYAGIDVGTVDGIQLLNDTAIQIEMSVEADLKRVIRKNSIASIGTDGLMGNTLVNISPGSTDAEFVSAGYKLTGIAGVNMDEMLRTLDITNNNVAVISANLRDLTNNINTSRGTLYTILMDTMFALKIHRTLDNIEVVSNNIVEVSKDLGQVTNGVKNGNGLLGTLIKDTLMTADLSKAINEIKMAGEQINTSAGELKQLLQKVNNGTGWVSTLINDTVSANHLKQSLVNIENSTRNFNENMEALKHNFLLKNYFKKQAKKNKVKPQK